MLRITSKNKHAKFSWLPHRMTLKQNPAFYRWFGLVFSFNNIVKKYDSQNS